MAYMAKNTEDFEIFRRRTPGTVRVSTESSKADVILDRNPVFGPATAEFRFIPPGNSFGGLCGRGC